MQVRALCVYSNTGLQPEEGGGGGTGVLSWCTRVRAGSKVEG